MHTRTTVTTGYHGETKFAEHSREFLLPHGRRFAPLRHGTISSRHRDSARRVSRLRSTIDEPTLRFAECTNSHRDTSNRKLAVIELFKGLRKKFRDNSPCIDWSLTSRIDHPKLVTPLTSLPTCTRLVTASRCSILDTASRVCDLEFIAIRIFVASYRIADQPM